MRKVLHIVPWCREWPPVVALCGRTRGLNVHRVPTRRGFTFLRLTKNEATKLRWCKRCLTETAKEKWRRG